MDATQHTGPATDLQDRIAVSKDYDMLQGLITVGTGISILLAAATRDFTWMAVGSCLSVAIGVTWYEKRYGKARSTRSRSAVTVLFSILVILAVVIASGFDQWRPGPLLWTPLVAGPLMLAGKWAGLRHTGLTMWHWISCVALTLCAFIPLFGYHPSFWFAMGTLALPLIVIGSVDHQRLVSALGKGTPDEQ
ncbi:hypothetical protein EDD41_0998 [Luteococcus japonicus]|uniref:Uncharacterized protein n=1 Tax=Luteococcus japonicus TaxID=33984 RepID=A0A3N1ZSH9_9ACTN|nr:hypothetical protein [Luteococcus japonicus]ROR53825.1 hypothetical protein EDD41_0998 [Luteococcus japonicus]